jgi:hypothetical protein
MIEIVGITDLVNSNGFIFDFMDFLFKTRSYMYQVMLKKTSQFFFK